MAAAALTYAEPFKTSLGGRFFTMTQVTVETTNEEYIKGGIALNYAKLGFPDALVDAIFMPSGLLDATFAKQYDTAIMSEKLILFQSGKEKEFNPEIEEGRKLAKYTGLIVALGR